MVSEEQRIRIRDLLIQRGLTFKPLQEEILDHICCDVEERMNNGVPFDGALSDAMKDIPENHFQTIQQSTMETINNRFTLSQWLSYATLGFLLCSVIFKILHLQFAGELMLFSLVLIAVTLLSVTLSGISMHREKRGAWRVLAVVIGVILLSVGYGFKISHLPGADLIISLSVFVLMISLIWNSVTFYLKTESHSNLLTYLHEKYTPGIERFLLYILLPVTFYKIIDIVIGDGSQFLGNLLLLITIFGGGLQFIALSWRHLETDVKFRSSSILISLILSNLFVLVFLGPLLTFEIRVFIIALYNFVTGWLAFKLDPARQTSDLIFSRLVPVLFLGWALVKIGIVSVDVNAYIFNPFILVALVAGLFLSKKNDTMRTYMIVSLGGYLVEYIH